MVIELTDREVNQLVAAFGGLSMPYLNDCLRQEICVIYLSKSKEEFEQRSKILAYLTYRINDTKTTN